MSEEFETRSAAQVLYPEAQPDGETKPDNAAESKAQSSQPESVPENWQGYDLGLGEGAGDGAMAGFKQAAHKSGLTARQAAQMAKWYGAASKPGQADPEHALIKAEQELKQEWGHRYRRNLDLANQAVTRFGGSELISAMKKSGLGINPAMVRAWAQVGAAISEDSFVSGVSAGAPKRSLAEILYDNS